MTKPHPTRRRKLFLSRHQKQILFCTVFCAVCLITLSALSLTEVPREKPVISTLPVMESSVFSQQTQPAAELLLPVSSSMSDKLSQSPPTSPAAPSFPVDLNTATVEQLAALEGIGEKLAQRIVDYRSAGHYFYSVSDLASVKGIGESVLKANWDKMMVDTSHLPVSSSVPVPVTEPVTVPASSQPEEPPEIPLMTQSIPEPKPAPTVPTLILTSPATVSTSTETSKTTKTTKTTRETTTTTRETTTVETTERETTTKRQVRFPLEINSAPAEDLMELDGIGPALASRIVRYRKELGGFYAIEDIMEVPGIGESIFSLIQYDIICDASGLPERETTTEPPETTVTTEFHPVNINTAELEELMTVPGMTENLAQGILQVREAIGTYSAMEELMLVDDMTNSRYLALTKYLTL